ncbi:hypothetical protein D9M73_129760 [compost metagenome]
MQMGRQARTALDRGQVAGFAIGGGMAFEAVQFVMGTRFARGPVRPEAGRPVGFGRQQAPLVKPLAARPMRGRGNARRFGQRRGRRHLLLQRAPERGEDLILPAAAGGDRPGRCEIVAAMTDEIEPLRHRTLGIAPPRLEMADAMHPGRAGFGGEFGERRVAPTPPQNQSRSRRAQIGIEAGKAMVQPPARRTAHRIMFGRLVIEDIQRHDRPLPDRSGKRWLVGQTQVTAQPEDRGSRQGTLHTRRREGAKVDFRPVE